MTHHQSIVLTVCATHRIQPEVFFGKTAGRKVVACRRAAIKALLEAGFDKKACARLMRRNYSTILYWCHEDWRERRKARMRANRLRYPSSQRLRKRAARALTHSHATANSHHPAEALRGEA